MRIQVKTKNFDLTESIAALIEERLSGVEKFVGNIENRDRTEGESILARVEVSRTNNHHNKGDVFKAEIDLEIPGEPNLRAEAVAEDLRSALNEARDELFRETRKSHEKNRTLIRKGAREFKNRIRGDE